MIKPIPMLVLAAVGSLSLVTIAEAFDFPARPMNPGPYTFDTAPTPLAAPAPPPPPPVVVEKPVRHRRAKHKVVAPEPQ